MTERTLRRSNRTSTPQKRSAPAPLSSVNTKRTRSGDNGKPKKQDQKSKYFEEEQNDTTSPEEELDEDASVVDAEESGYEDDDASAIPSESSAGEDPYDVTSEEEKPKKASRGRPKKSTGAKAASNASEQSKGQELWRPGVKTGLGFGTEVIIKKPKAREAGANPYADDTIHPNTLLFLKDLKANNDREWLKMHDLDFRTSEKDFKSFVECLTAKIAEVDETVPELPVKDLVHRIYRDIRFSKDPTPYKPHFSASWSRTGRKGPYAGYHVQIKPGDNFIGGGLWMPEAQAVSLIRRDIDRKPHRLKRALMHPGLREEFFGVKTSDESKVTAKFVAGSSEGALKRAPKDYPIDHKDIALLRLRSFVVGTKLTDKEILMPHVSDHIVRLISHMVPFITYLNSVVMPDDDSSSDEEGNANEGSTDLEEEDGGDE